jgi:hypothetical protein
MLTAVDILFEKIEKIPFQSPDAGALYDDIIKLYEESKEMEKQQIIEAVKSTDYIIGATNKESEEFAQQYYNETFKKC